MQIYKKFTYASCMGVIRGIYGGIYRDLNVGGGGWGWVGGQKVFFEGGGTPRDPKMRREA